MNKFNNKEVRRQDRLLSKETSLELLRNGEYAILSMIEENTANAIAAYGIPLNYAWDGEDFIYIHCAPQGHKLDCMDKYPNVSMVVVGATEVVSSKFTTNYESVVVRGKAARSLEPLEKMRALELILDKYCPKDKEAGMMAAEKSFERTEVLRIEIESISGKTKGGA